MNADLPERSEPVPGERSLDAPSAVPASQGSPAERPKLDFLVLYEELFPFVWRVARRRGIPASSLDDVCQDVFVIVHQKLAAFEGRSSVKTWVYGILNNVVLMRHRTAGRRERDREDLDPELVVDEAAGPDLAASFASAARIAEALLARLDDDKRTMFMLVELEGMSVPEAAEAVEANVNTAYARLRAARIEIAEAVARLRARERRVR